MATAPEQESFDTFIKLNTYDKLNRLFADFGYLFKIPPEDPRVKKALGILVMCGFIKEELHDKQLSDKQINDIWFRNLGYFIYKNISQDKWDFERLIVHYEFVNVYYAIMTLDEFKEIVEKDKKQKVSQRRQESLDRQCNGISYLHRLFEYSKILIQNNGLNDSDFETKFQSITNVIKNLIDYQFGENYQIMETELGHAMDLLASLQTESEIKTGLMKKLEGKKVSSQAELKVNKEKIEEYKQFKRAVTFIKRRILEIQQFESKLNKNENQSIAIRRVKV